MADTKKVLTWVGLGCGTLLLIGAGSCVGLYYWGKGKIQQTAKEMGVDPSKGGQAMASAMVLKSVEFMGPQVKAVLPPEDQAGFDKAMGDLKAKVNKLGKSDIDAISNALRDYSVATRAATEAGGKPGPEPARKLIQDLQTIADRH